MKQIEVARLCQFSEAIIHKHMDRETGHSDNFAYLIYELLFFFTSLSG